MIKNILLILIITFFIQSSKADDITEFEIEGMSINESLLNFMTKEEIEKELTNEKSFYYDNKKYVSILSSQKIYENLTIYDDLSIVLNPNDKQFLIKGLEGLLIIKNDIISCQKKQQNIASDINKLFSENFLDKAEYDIEKDQLDEFKSINYVDLVFPNNSGEFRIACKEKNDKENYLYVIINSSEFLKFLHKL